MIDRSDANDLADGFTRLVQSLDQFGRSSSTASARIDAGGWGVWAATSACLIMLSVSFMGAIWVSHQFGSMQREIDKLERKSETQEAYLQAIYQIAPQLNPKSDTETSSKESAP